MISKRTSRALATHADTAPGYWMIGVLWRMLATGVQTGNAMCLLDQFCSKGSGPTRHAHTQDEGLYVADGKVTFSAGGTELAAGPGCLVNVPRRTEHSFIVDEDAVLINFYFPAGFDLWLMGSASPALRNELPPSDMPLPPYDLMKTLSDDYTGLPLTRERSTAANPAAPALPAMTSRSTAEAVWFDRGCWSILADAASTGGSYSVFEVELPQGLGEAPRIHDGIDKAYYVLDGALEVLADNEVLSLRKGSFAFVPRGCVHAVRVTSGTARFLNIHTAPGYERVIRAAGRRAEKAGLPPQDWRPDGAASARAREIHADIGLRTVLVPAGFQA